MSTETDEIARHIENLEEALSFLRHLQDAPQVHTTSPPPPTESSGVMNWLKLSEWPLAVDPTLICRESEEDKYIRAEAILDLVNTDVPFEGSKVLDFGCGEGHLARKLIDRGAKTAVGYDLVDSGWQFGEVSNFTITTDPEKVNELGPYDLVIAYDVLDHSVTQEPAKALEFVKNVLSPNGKIFVRCHPWCCRHGTHIYKQINKAFVHLVLSEDELKEQGYGVGVPTIKVLHPLATYRGWFDTAGVRVVSESMVHDLLEPFFVQNQTVADRIRANWQDSPDPPLASGAMFPDFQMGQSFIDYVLEA